MVSRKTARFGFRKNCCPILAPARLGDLAATCRSQKAGGSRIQCACRFRETTVVSRVACDLPLTLPLPSKARGVRNRGAQPTVARFPRQILQSDCSHTRKRREHSKAVARSSKPNSPAPLPVSTTVSRSNADVCPRGRILSYDRPADGRRENRL